MHEWKSENPGKTWYFTFSTLKHRSRLITSLVPQTNTLLWEYKRWSAAENPYFSYISLVRKTRKHLFFLHLGNLFKQMQIRIFFSNSHNNHTRKGLEFLSFKRRMACHMFTIFPICFQLSLRLNELKIFTYDPGFCT